MTEPASHQPVLADVDDFLATELLDRTEKRRDYQRLASLRHYVLIAQDAPRDETYSREGAGWRFAEIEGLEATLALDGLGTTLPLAELYDGLTFAAPPAAAEGA